MQAWHTTERNQHVTFAALHTEMVLVRKLKQEGRHLCFRLHALCMQLQWL